MASAEWQLGDRARAKAMAVEASQLSPEAALPPRLAAVLAQVGDPGRARLLIARLAADQPKDTLLNSVWVPLTESSLALGETNPMSRLRRSVLPNGISVGGLRSRSSALLKTAGC